MKISKLYSIAIALVIFSAQACKNSSLQLEKQLRYSGSKLHINPNQARLTQKATCIIYDYTAATAGLQKRRIEVKPTGDHSKADIITAFLTHNHILKKAAQVKLLKIEEVGTNTHFYLSSISDLEDPSTQKLFNEALELTLLRHLKTKDFHIIYNKTASI